MRSGSEAQAQALLPRADSRYALCRWLRLESSREARELRFAPAFAPPLVRCDAIRCVPFCSARAKHNPYTYSKSAPIDRLPFASLHTPLKHRASSVSAPITRLLMLCWFADHWPGADNACKNNRIPNCVRLRSRRTSSARSICIIARTSSPSRGLS